MYAGAASEPVPIAVRSYSGCRLHERPLALIVSGQEYAVARIDSRWLEMDSMTGIVCSHFQVQCSNDLRCHVAYNPVTESWILIQKPTLKPLRRRIL